MKKTVEAAFITLAVIICYFFLISPARISYKSSKPPSPTENPVPAFVPNPITIEGVFVENHTKMKDLPTEKIRTLIATGDVIPARAVNFQVLKLNNFLWPWEKTAEVLSAADITLINLEAPLLKNCQPTNQGMVFCGDQRHIDGLKFSGVDVVNLANNHLGNYGPQGAEETVNLLKTNEIESCGVGEWALKNILGLRFAFLGYNDVGTSPNPVSPAEENLIASQIKAAREQADLIIVSFHWGNEYVTQPSIRQRDLAHLAVDSGADLVIGNHPHWIQPVEIYKDKIITYAHGNFIFDQTWSEETKKGVIGRYTFYENKLIDAEFSPIYIQGYGQPNFLPAEEGNKILREMKEASLKLAQENLGKT
ncbi:MAG: CapA family protein [bacterium]|nr:CapA family protein [bacterium]